MLPGDQVVVTAVASPHAMQTVIVHLKLVIDVGLTAIIRSQLELVPACTPDEHQARPTHCEVVPLPHTWPISACAALIDPFAPAPDVSGVRTHAWNIPQV
jgi:hypothetical protein